MNNSEIISSSEVLPGGGAQHVFSLPTPIFILGIAPRSGTNYLHDLIRMHPMCDPDSSVLEEDFLVAQSHLLLKYIQGVSRFWKEKWGDDELKEERRLLSAKIGEGLVSFLYAQLERRKELAQRTCTRAAQRPRLVTKTPEVINLELFFELFPSARLLVLVRDGRSVAESAAHTFNKPHGYTAREWATSAKRILDFKRRNPHANYMIVRYEDLYQNVEGELRSILSFLGLDPGLYDYSAAANLPVRGSSALRAPIPDHRKDFWVAEGVHWNPTPKPPDFNPLFRWQKWDRAKHERFNWIAGGYMPAFGYSLQCYTSARAFWSLWNIACDALLVDQTLWLWRRGVRRLKRIHSMPELLEALRDMRRKMWESALFSRLQKER